MMKLTLLLSLLMLFACSTTSKNSRTLSSVEKELTGTYLGAAVYNRSRVGPNKPAVRIYFDPIQGETGKYNVVLLEYVDLLKMAPSYIASNKLPLVARTFGYLKNITHNISAYEAVPGAKENTFELWPLVVSGDQIVVKRDATPRILTLDAEATVAAPLDGATISKTSEGEPNEIFFTKAKGGKKPGLQLKTARTAYKIAKLESTWRKDFLKGPYLSQYYKRDDVVLKLRDNNIAEFVINPKYAKMSEKKRAAMFTHPDSAFLQGEFSVTEPREGMFLFQSVNTDEKTNGIVKNKIGLFIDIFDATKSMGQDVVELALIDSEKPADFLMYYEDPENGEGTNPSAPQQ